MGSRIREKNIAAMLTDPKDPERVKPRDSGRNWNPCR